MHREDTIGGASYKNAGVNIDAGAALVEDIKPLATRTARPGVTGILGGFGAIFDLKATGYRDPLLVATTDGVGTKLKLAAAAGRHRGVGVDLVAMCVNDLVVQGAEPIFFLDYYATGSLDIAVAREVLAGIADGCAAAGCALIGGETAEMPGMYGAGEYDLAGFAVGAVERDAVLTGAEVAEGDAVLGLASSGLHSNGFSLVRQVLSQARLGIADPAPFAPGRDLADALLEPTRIYVRACLGARKALGWRLRALAHITGGGLIENIPRVLPVGLGVDLDAAAWPLPEAMRWIAGAGQLPPAELARTFNCGIGMAVICAAEAAEEAAALFADCGETVHVIGRVASREASAPRVRFANMGAAWRA